PRCRRCARDLDSGVGIYLQHRVAHGNKELPRTWIKCESRRLRRLDLETLGDRLARIRRIEHHDLAAILDGDIRYVPRRVPGDLLRTPLQIDRRELSVLLAERFERDDGYRRIHRIADKQRLRRGK